MHELKHLLGHLLLFFIVELREAAVDVMIVLEFVNVGVAFACRVVSRWYILTTIKEE
jgi:hypothetical protein